MTVKQWFGTYTAQVHNTADPQNANRVQLKIPQVFGQAVSQWAVPTTPGGTPPSPGQTVTAMFVGGDPSHPTYINQGPTGGGAGLSPTAVKTSNYTANPGEMVLCDLSAGSFTVTLPLYPPDGTQVGVQIVNVTYNYQQWDNNGNPIGRWSYNSSGSPMPQYTLWVLTGNGSTSRWGGSQVGIDKFWTYYQDPSPTYPGFPDFHDLLDVERDFSILGSSAVWQYQASAADGAGRWFAVGPDSASFTSRSGSGLSFMSGVEGALVFGQDHDQGPAIIAAGGATMGIGWSGFYGAYNGQGLAGQILSDEIQPSILQASMAAWFNSHEINSPGIVLPSGPDSVVISFPSLVTSTIHYKIVIGVWSSSSETITSVTDNMPTPNTFTVDGTVTNSGITLSFYRVDVAPNPVPAGGYEVTINASGGHPVTAGVRVYQSLPVGGPSIAAVSNTGTSGTAVTGSYTPTSTGNVFIAAVATDYTSSDFNLADAPGPFIEIPTPDGQAYDGTSYTVGDMATLWAQTGPVAETNTWTVSSADWATLILAYPNPSFASWPAGTVRGPSQYADAIYATKSTTWGLGPGIPWFYYGSSHGGNEDFFAMANGWDVTDYSLAPPDAPFRWRPLASPPYTVEIEGVLNAGTLADGTAPFTIAASGWQQMMQYGWLQPLMYEQYLDVKILAGASAAPTNTPTIKVDRSSPPNFTVQGLPAGTTKIRFYGIIHFD